MKIALCGYKGKVGKEVYSLLKENKYKVIGVDIDSKPLHEIIEHVDLVIDFTNKNQALKHIYTCIDYHKPFICGTTSFTSLELALIKKLCNKENVKGIICYNFAIPINIILKQIDYLKKYFTEMEYIDIHHVSKIDKVSGTTYLFLLKNDKFIVKSYKTHKNTIVYIIKMLAKYDKMILTYIVDDRKAFAIGLLNYLKTKDEGLITNLLE